jgi:hypothetical protein
MSREEEDWCTNPHCSCSGHPDNCCTPESIKVHKEAQEALNRKYRPGKNGISVEADG